MKVLNIKNFLTVSLLFYLPMSMAGEVIFESDVQVKKNAQSSFESLKAGQSLPLQAGDSFFIITPQNMPLLIFSPSKTQAKFVVADTNISAALQEQLQPVVQKATSEIIEGLRRTETLIQKKDYSQAHGILLTLKSKYPNISSLLFMSGTLNYLTNNKTAAIEDLQKGLSLDPANEPAKKLLAQLKGVL